MGTSLKLSVLVFLGVFASCCLAERSLFLRKKESEANSQSRFAVLHAPGYVNFVEPSVALPAKEVGAVSAFALGLAPGKTLTWDGLSPGSLFHRPRANIMFVVDGVNPGDLLRVSPQQSSQLTADAGQSVHTVAGGKTLGAHVSDLFHGSPLVVSSSARKQDANAAGAAGENSVAMFYDHSTKQVLTSPTGKALAMTTKQMEDSLASLQLPAGYRFDRNTFAIVSHGAPVLSMAQEESASFLAELASVQRVVSTLSADSQLVRDNIPDVLTFSVSSLKDLHVQFGSDSPQVKAAMDVLSGVIPLVASELSKLYNGDAIIELVEITFDGEQFLTHAGDVSSLYDVLGEHLQTQTLASFRANLPRIRLSEEASYKVACQKARDSVSASTLEVVCDLTNSETVVSGRRLLSVADVRNATDNVNGTQYNLAYVRSDEWTAVFTMFLVVFLIFALSVLAISNVMWNMDPGSDSIIYRMTNQRIKMD